MGALGDLLVSLEALKITCDRFPNAQVWIVGSALWLDLIEPTMWPRVNGIIVSEDGKWGQMFEYSPIEREWVLVGEKRKLSLFAKSCQASVNLRIESFRFSWFVWPWVPIRIGSCPWVMKWLYTHWLPWLGKEPAIHERDWYSLVAGAGREEKPLALPYQLKMTGLPPLKMISETKLRSLWKLEKGKYVLVNPTASRREKAWPSEKFRKLCGKLESEKLEVIVIGAPKETEWLKEVAGENVRLIQPKSLMDLADVVGGARFLVTNTSSLQFVAASMKTPVITLMGLAAPLRWGPVGSKDKTVCAKEDFSSMKDLFERDRAAYASIPFELVWSAVKTFL